MTVYLIDTNVLIDVVSKESRWLDWSVGQLAAALRAGTAIINPIIYAEVSTAFASMARLDAVLAELSLTTVQIPPVALFVAGRAFRDYRRRGGPRPSILPDFFIGAHAAVEGFTLITRDTRRRRYFPTVATITP